MGVSGRKLHNRHTRTREAVKYLTMACNRKGYTTDGTHNYSVLNKINDLRGSAVT